MVPPPPARDVKKEAANAKASHADTDQQVQSHITYKYVSMSRVEEVIHVNYTVNNCSLNAVYMTNECVKRWFPYR